MSEVRHYTVLATALLAAGLLFEGRTAAHPNQPAEQRAKATIEQLDAEWWGRTPEVQALLAGSNPNARDNKFARTALAWAVIANDHAAFKRLAGLNADVNAVDRFGWAPLHHAAGLTSHETQPFVEALLAAGADPNIRMPQDYTPLMLAANHDRPHIARPLLAKLARPDIETRNAFGNTALAIAAGAGAYQVVLLLIEKGADVNSSDRNGMTPLLHASGLKGGGGPPSVQLLIEAGARLDVKDMDGLTPLQRAVRYGRPETADLLRKAGAK